MVNGVVMDMALSFIAGLVVMVPLGIRWQFRLGQTVSRSLFMSLVCLAASRLFPNEWGLAPRFAAMACMALLQLPVVVLPFFYADPERIVKASDEVVLSPADGRIVYVRKSANGSVPVGNKHGSAFELDELLGHASFDGDCFLVGISMNLLDVHVNRAPIGGVVSSIEDSGDSFISLRESSAVLRNCRRTTIFDSGDTSIAVVQIASRLVRRIVSFVKPGSVVSQGERFGMIRLGSQVDVAVPSVIVEEVLVEEGRIVKAGLTPLLRIRRGHASRMPSRSG